MVRPSRAKRRASRCTLVTRGQVASITRSLRRCASSRTVGGTPCALKISTAPIGTSSTDSTKMAPPRLDHVAVVYDFVVHIDRGTIGFQCQLNYIHGPNHARAKSTWTNSQQ